MKKLKVLLRISQVANCGVGYYRQWLPLKKLEEKGLIELKTFDYNGGKKEIKEPFVAKLEDGRMTDIKLDKDFEEACTWADIIYACRDESAPYIAVLGGLKEALKKPVVIDVDDYVQFTRPHNPGYISFNPYSVHNKLNFKLLNIADGMTVSTDYLKKVYKNENKKRYTCPNSIDVPLRNKSLGRKPIIKKKKDEVRIGWAGSASHYENLKPLLEPIRKIMLENENVTFHYTGLFGDLFKWDDLGDRIRTVKFVSLDKWPDQLKGMGLDIALAPLVDNHFNRAKSNLRVLEYWSCKYPVIASPVLPYKFIKKGKDGLLAMEEWEWYDEINKLIKSKDKREELSEKGYKRLCDEFDVNKTCMIWYDALKKFVK